MGACVLWHFIIEMYITSESELWGCLQTIHREWGREKEQVSKGGRTMGRRNGEEKGNVLGCRRTSRNGWLGGRSVGRDGIIEVILPHAIELSE